MSGRFPGEAEANGLTLTLKLGASLNSTPNDSKRLLDLEVCAGWVHMGALR